MCNEGATAINKLREKDFNIFPADATRMSFPKLRLALELIALPLVPPSSLPIKGNNFSVPLPRAGA